VRRSSNAMTERYAVASSLHSASPSAPFFTNLSASATRFASSCYISSFQARVPREVVVPARRKHDHERAALR
jgi:hypothetical protein